MKKMLLMALAITMTIIGAFAQGSILLTDQGPGPGVATDNATSWVTASPFDLQVWWSPGINANISSLNSVYLSQAYEEGEFAFLLPGDGFTDEANVTVSVNGGTFTYNILGLALPNIPTDTINTFALVGSANIGGVAFGGIIAFVNSDGGNLGANGMAASLSGWDASGQNLIMFDNYGTANIPEPTTMALVGIGSLSFLLFRCDRIRSRIWRSIKLKTIP